MQILRNTHNEKNSIEIREELTQQIIKLNNNNMIIDNKFSYTSLPKQVLNMEKRHWIQ